MEKSYIHRVPSQPITSNFRAKPRIQNEVPNTTFADELQKAVKSNSELQISKHAKLRMEQRGINIGDQTWKAIQLKLDEAKKKGVNESLVLLKDAALIVSAKNQTVITAMNKEEANAQIFTNIDGTILIDS